MRRPDRTTSALAGVLILALGLRLWGIRSGLPFSYDADEERHFVPIAARFFGSGLNPHYFLNPPGYTELLLLADAVRYGGGGAVRHTLASDPGELFLTGRVVVALLGTAAVWLLHLAGARLFDRRVGLLAAALGAVAFLPVFYGHLALNDVPALAAATLALVATAHVLRGGPGVPAVALGGLAAGLAAGTKYTAGIALLPLLSAVLVQRPALRPAAGRVALALAAALAGFLVANPYALLDLHGFRAGLALQQHYTSGDELAKLGLTQNDGVVYYLWTLTWGVGWIPAFAALGGALRLLARDRRLALVLLPAPLLYVAYMGGQERYFGRWLLPVLPIVLLLAAYFAAALVRAAARRWPPLRLPATVLVALAMLGQGAYASVHVDRVLARPDTRGTLRGWLLAHVPRGSGVVVEPFVPRAWLSGTGWRLWDTARADVDDHAVRLPGGRTRYVKVDRYERTLRPALLDEYAARGYCWIAIGSMQQARALAQPQLVPDAIAYYRELARRADLLLRVSPYGAGASAPAFSFDWSFDYYPGAYARPGPQVEVYRLRGCS
jgi:Dolichyl-phosphate-mannose-protein mannosyltransferase